MVYKESSWRPGSSTRARDKGIVPKAPPKKYQEVNTVRSLHLGFADKYQLRATEGYLKANSAGDMPLTLFPVSGRLYWTIVLCSGRLYIIYKLDIYIISVFIYFIYWAQEFGRLYINGGRLSRRLHVSLDVYTLFFFRPNHPETVVSHHKRMYEVKNWGDHNAAYFPADILEG